MSRVKNITQKQENFARKYFECGNATEAYMYAYSYKKMQTNTIRVRASELLTNKHIVAKLKELKIEAEKATQWNVKRVINTYAKVIEIGLANAETHKIVTDGTGKGYTTTKSIKAKETNLAAVNTALNAIAKHLGMFKDNDNLVGVISLTDLIKKAAQQ